MYRAAVDQKSDAANAVHLLRNLTVKNRQPKRLDLDLLPDPFFDIGLTRKPGIEIRPAWKFGEHNRSDHLAGIIENRAGRAQLASFNHRLDAREVCSRLMPLSHSQRVRFARPDILFCDAHPTDLY